MPRSCKIQFVPGISDGRAFEILRPGTLLGEHTDARGLDDDIRHVAQILSEDCPHTLSDDEIENGLYPQHARKIGRQTLLSQRFNEYGCSFFRSVTRTSLVPINHPYGPRGISFVSLGYNDDSVYAVETTVALRVIRNTGQKRRWKPIKDLGRVVHLQNPAEFLATRASS
jgi:hypothetical protein